jgi:hypothetical protein
VTGKIDGGNASRMMARYMTCAEILATPSSSLIIEDLQSTHTV